MKISDAAHWERAECRACGHVFFRTESYKSDCTICFKDTRGYEIYSSDIQVRCLQLEIEKLTKSLQAKTMQTSKAERQLAKQMKMLLFLCHPDKHKGSKRSHEVTQWLLKLRGQILSTRR
jgi:hypothetical protein